VFRFRRPIAILLGLISIATFAVVPALAAVENVTGTLHLPEGTVASETAVAVITLTDRSPDGVGTIVGQQRIDGAAGAQIPFAVPFERDDINNEHAYSVQASLLDGEVELQNLVPVPVITGGPTQDVNVTLAAPEFANPAAITGTIAVPEETELTITAVAYAAIFNATSGRLVARQITPSPDTFPIPFTVPFDLDLIDPEATYVAAAAVIDGTTLWQTDAPVAIDPSAPLSLPVALRDQTIPPGPVATPTVAPATPTSAAVTPTPAAATPTSAAPTIAPTPTQTPTTTDAPTTTPPVTPTATPIATPAPTPEPTLAPSQSPTPVVVPDQVAGTLVYREPYELSSAAYASVAVVQVIDGAVVVLGSARFDNPGPVPIPFQVRLNQELVDLTVQAQLWAIVVDGNDAWVTAEGVAVATLGAPTADVLVRLSFRPDVLNGQVTGVTVGAGSELSAEAVSMTYVLNASTLQIIGFDSRLVAGADPIPFAVPFSVADLDEGQAYIAESFVYDGQSTWTTVDGTPVITSGNPMSDVTVTVSQITTPPPTPAPTSAPTPAPSAAPTPPADTGGINPLWLLLALAGIIGLIVIFLVMRRNDSDETPNTDEEAPPAEDTPPAEEAPPAEDTSDDVDTGQHGGGPA
jgi:uncharacterized lipoprotein YbaY